MEVDVKKYNSNLRTLYIFGDSFSSDYNSRIFIDDITKFFYNIYYRKEVENGHIGKYRDLEYYFKNNIPNTNIINTAEPGFSNTSIFEKFSIQSIKFKPGDYVSFQTTHYFRFRVSGKNYDFIDINPNGVLNNFNFVKNFNIKEIKNLMIEYNEKPYLNESINFVKMVRHICKLSRVNFHIWSLDDNLNSLSTLPNIINKELSIGNKYIEIKDIHPTFEGNEHIVNNIVKNWET